LGQVQASGKGWIPVDISEANKNPSLRDYYFGNLTENRVGFTVGRDLTLVPKQDGSALNFFVYPYVEIDGKPYPATRSAGNSATRMFPASRSNNPFSWGRIFPTWHGKLGAIVVPCDPDHFFWETFSCGKSRLLFRCWPWLFW